MSATATFDYDALFEAPSANDVFLPIACAEREEPKPTDHHGVFVTPSIGGDGPHFVGDEPPVASSPTRSQPPPEPSPGKCVVTIKFRVEDADVEHHFVIPTLRTSTTFDCTTNMPAVPPPPVPYGDAPEHEVVVVEEEEEEVLDIDPALVQAPPEMVEACVTTEEFEEVVASHFAVGKLTELIADHVSKMRVDDASNIASNIEELLRRAGLVKAVDASLEAQVKQVEEREGIVRAHLWNEHLNELLDISSAMRIKEVAVLRANAAAAAVQYKRSLADIRAQVENIQTKVQNRAKENPLTLDDVREVVQKAVGAHGASTAPRSAEMQISDAVWVPVF